MDTKRSTLVVSALVLLVLLGVGHLFVPLAPDADKIPAVVQYGDVALGILSLVTAFGLWGVKRWGVVLTYMIAALNIVSAAPGIVAAPNAMLRVVTAIYVLVSLLIIGLMAISGQRRPSAQRIPTARA
ncbi:MAG TPA: hypothetical protein VFU60_20580 [Ktedonobacterales bacterium]|nr:hypothetical protein [Ktedonobacterales bacterium]